VVVVSGGFPESLEEVVDFHPTKFRRHEYDLWWQVLQQSHETVPAFSDHGVTHPEPPGDHRDWGPADLRYTNGPYWYVLRAPSGATSDGFRLCDELVGSPAWPANQAGLSWGDRQIRLRRDRVADGPGGHRERRAWDTSHHLAAVVRSIIRGGHP
jgi:hypothetical protein